MSAAALLSNSLERKNRHWFAYILSFTTVVLLIFVFMTLQWLHRSTLESLLESQGTPAAYQEWRVVRNGIRSGWRWWPPTSDICLLHLGKPVFAETQCPEQTLAKKVLGTLVVAQSNGVEARLAIAYSPWGIALIVTLIFLGPLAFFAILLRIPIARQTQVNLLNALTHARSEQNNSLTSFQQTVRAETEEIVKLRNAAALAKVATQVAHDIRSPLAALDVALQDTIGMPEHAKILLRASANRIKDIANDLLERHRVVMALGGKTEVESATLNNSSSTTIELIAAHLETMVSEKRLQHRARLNIDIVLTWHQGALGAFASVHAIEFKRVISNLVNNAVESIASHGRVELSLVSDESLITIHLSDTGKGIPAELLTRLGEEGLTSGKPEGSGLGLFHAKEQVKKWNGDFKLSSEVGKGTCVTITLPQSHPPKWALPRLRTAQDSVVVVVDDEPAIHALWDQKFSKLSAMPLLHFTTSEDFENWLFSSGYQKMKNALFLIDFELGASEPRNGLDLIVQHNLQKHSVLVTSRFEEPEVRLRCETNSIKLVSKQLTSILEIELVEGQQHYDAILIDDSTIVHMSWKLKARKSNKKLACFFTLREFQAAVTNLAKDTAIYIDSQLGDGVAGEDVALELAALGFKEIYLATGYNPSYFDGSEVLGVIKGIIGKEPPSTWL